MKILATVICAVSLLAMGCDDKSGTKPNGGAAATSGPGTKPADLDTCRQAAMEIVGKQLAHPGSPLNNPGMTPELIKTAGTALSVRCTDDKWTVAETSCAMLKKPDELATCFSKPGHYDAIVGSMKSNAPK